jgi:hypothetical protein
MIGSTVRDTHSLSEDDELGQTFQSHFCGDFAWALRGDILHYRPLVFPTLLVSTSMFISINGNYTDYPT